VVIYCGIIRDNIRNHASSVKNVKSNILSPLWLFQVQNSWTLGTGDLPVGLLRGAPRNTPISGDSLSYNVNEKHEIFIVATVRRQQSNVIVFSLVKISLLPSPKGRLGEKRTTKALHPIRQWNVLRTYTHWILLSAPFHFYSKQMRTGNEQRVNTGSLRILPFRFFSFSTIAHLLIEFEFSASSRLFYLHQFDCDWQSTPALILLAMEGLRITFRASPDALTLLGFDYIPRADGC
jgi:hypothetical protein